MLISRPGRWLAAALWLSAPAIATTPALAAPPAANPFAKVPALPTACYSSQDQWQEASTAAFDAVQADHYKQDEINDGIRQSATDTFGADPMAVAARMQQKMMEDPANAQKYMQEMLAQQQQAQEVAPAQHEREQQIADESKTLMKQYEAALEKARSVGNARLAALTKRHSPPEGIGRDLWLRYGDPGEPAWVEPERRAILKQFDEGYAANCAQWWSATGKFHAYLKRYKDFLVNERIPLEKQGDTARLEHYNTIGVATTGWRTVTDYKAAEDYIKMAQNLFQMREIEPLCSTKTPCP